MDPREQSLLAGGDDADDASGPGRERMETVASLSILDDDDGDNGASAANLVGEPGAAAAAPVEKAPRGSVTTHHFHGRDGAETCCGGTVSEAKCRVVILIVASAALVLSALAAALGIALTPASCASGYCAAYKGQNIAVVRNMPGQAPSFIRFAQTVHEQATCSAPRAFVVGGMNATGWAQRWALTTTEDAQHIFQSATSLVANTSGELNWPHSVALDPCTGALYVANANDNVIDKLTCTKPVVGDNFQVSCEQYSRLLNFTSVFYNPLGLHEIVRDGSLGTDGSCSGGESTAEGLLLVTGGTFVNDSFVGKYLRDGSHRFLVAPERHELNKVYSPTVRANGSLLVADAFNNRIAQIDCEDTSGAPVSCVADTAVYGSVSTAVADTYYPRAVAVAANLDGSETAFFAGGNAVKSATYVKKIDLATGTITTIVPGGILDRPHCVAIDPESLDLIVCDKGNDRVVRIPCATPSS